MEENRLPIAVTQIEKPGIFGSIWHIIANIKLCLYATSVDIKKYFYDLDKTKEDLITELEFISVLTLALEDVLGLTETQAKALANFFKNTDGRILYKEFLKCIDLKDEIIQHPDMVSGMEWSDHRFTNYLTPREQQYFDKILDEIAGRVYSLDISLECFTKEYELLTSNKGTMTISQFGTLLNAIRVRLDRKELCLLVKKYSKHNFTINYLAFVRDVEERIATLKNAGMLEKYAGIDERYLIKIRPTIERIPGDVMDDGFDDEPIYHPSTRQKCFAECIEDVLRQVQYSICREQMNLEQFFKIYDPLRKGLITDNQFRRVLAMIGIDITGPNFRLILKPIEMNQLIDRYRDSLDPTYICYQSFINEVGELSKFPICGRNPSSCPGISHFTSLRELRKYKRTRGNLWYHTSQTHKDACESALSKLMKYLKDRKIHLRADFRRLDTHNTGHVSYVQFKNIIFNQQIYFVSTLEFKGLHDRYVNYKGFNYRRFLDEIHEDTQEVAPSTTKMGNQLFQEYVPPTGTEVDFSREARVRYRPKIKEKVDIADVINKVKQQIARYALLIEPFFEQYNPHKESYMPITLFERAFNSAGLRLKPEEVETLYDYYQTPFMKGCVDYQRFINTAYSSEYQLGLEKAPLIIPVKSAPVQDGRHNFLNFDERHKLQVAMRKLATYSDIITREIFREFDRHHFGTVDRTNLPRIFSYIGRNSEHLLTEDELDVVYKGFSRLRGTYVEMDYNAFCKALKYIKEFKEDNNM